jgi:hypothetical protein
MIFKTVLYKEITSISSEENIIVITFSDLQGRACKINISTEHWLQRKKQEGNKK